MPTTMVCFQTSAASNLLFGHAIANGEKIDKIAVYDIMDIANDMWGRFRVVRIRHYTPIEIDSAFGGVL